MTERPSITAGLAIFLIALFGLLGFSFLTAVLSAAQVRLGGYAYVLTIGFQGLFFALPPLLYYWKRPSQQPAFRLRRLDPLCALYIVPAALLGMLALNWVSVFWSMFLQELGLVTSTGNDAAPRTLSHLWLSLAASAIAPALFEEILFRGLLLPSLEPMGDRFSIAVSGAMFALLHGRVEALPAHLLLGITLAWLVIRTGSLYSSMLFHVVYNAAIMVLAYFAATTGPASMNTMPTVSQALQTLPIVAAMLIGWILLLHAAAIRGEKTVNSPLLPAEPQKPSRTARILLAVSGILLFLIELNAILAMLPGRNAT